MSEGDISVNAVSMEILLEMKESFICLFSKGAIFYFYLRASNDFYTNDFTKSNQIGIFVNYASI